MLWIEYCDFLLHTLKVVDIICDLDFLYMYYNLLIESFFSQIRNFPKVSLSLQGRITMQRLLKLGKYHGCIEQSLDFLQPIQSQKGHVNQLLIVKYRKLPKLILGWGQILFQMSDTSPIDCFLFSISSCSRRRQEDERQSVWKYTNRLAGYHLYVTGSFGPKDQGYTTR